MSDMFLYEIDLPANESNTGKSKNLNMICQEIVVETIPFASNLNVEVKKLEFVSANTDDQCEIDYAFDVVLDHYECKKYSESFRVKKVTKLTDEMYIKIKGEK